MSDIDAVRLVDLLGTGVSGVLWSTDASGLSRSNAVFPRFYRRGQTVLADEMDNHMGAVTRVTYAPSTRFYVEDEQRPVDRWKTPLPFPVQVVAQVEVIDAMSDGKLTTEYRYHHGYWDGAEREFRGFGRVDQCDTEVFRALQRRWAACGSVCSNRWRRSSSRHRWRRAPGSIRVRSATNSATGKRLTTVEEYWSGDPQVLTRPQSHGGCAQHLAPSRPPRCPTYFTRQRSAYGVVCPGWHGTTGDPYTVTESLYGVREESPPAAGDTERLRIFFPHALAQRTTQWERGNDPMTQFAFTDDYDAYGQPRSQISIAVPRGRDYRVSSGSG